MARSQVATVALVLLTLVFAGCVSDEVVPDDTPSAAAEAEATEKSGSVTGQVITVDLDLVKGVEVGLVNRTGAIVVTTTDTMARYTFNDVTPGPYRIQVDAPCCKTASVAVEVLAGKVAELNLQLERLTAADLVEPFRVDHQWDGFISCDVSTFSAGQDLCGTLQDPNHDSIMNFDIQPGLQELVLGMEWDENTLAADVYGNALGLHLHRIRSECEDCDWQYLRIDKSSPIVAYVHDANIENDTRDWRQMDEPWNMRFSIYSGGTNVVYQQAFTMYFYEFYHKRAPVDFDPLARE